MFPGFQIAGLPYAIVASHVGLCNVMGRLMCHAGVLLAQTHSHIRACLTSKSSSRSMYTDHHGRLSILHGLKEAMWHSISHTLSIDVFRVNAFPSRIVTVAYGFLVLILTNTYTANLAAFLTVDQLDAKINDVSDLKGRSVATIQPYVKRLRDNYGIAATDRDGWDYDMMIKKLRAGQYAAVISDDTQLEPRARADDSCALRILTDKIEPFDLAIAFRKNFPYPELVRALNNALLKLQETGQLAVRLHKYVHVWFWYASA